MERIPPCNKCGSFEVWAESNRLRVYESGLLDYVPNYRIGETDTWVLRCKCGKHRQDLRMKGKVLVLSGLPQIES